MPECLNLSMRSSTWIRSRKGDNGKRIIKINLVHFCQSYNKTSARFLWPTVHIDAYFDGLDLRVLYSCHVMRTCHSEPLMTLTEASFLPQKFITAAATHDLRVAFTSQRVAGIPVVLTPTGQLCFNNWMRQRVAAVWRIRSVSWSGEWSTSEKLATSRQRAMPLTGKRLLHVGACLHRSSVV